MFSSSPLVESCHYDRFGSPDSPTLTEVDLPIEVDQSFNSSMSLTDPTPSPAPPSPSTKPQFMNSDLSPLPFRRPDPVPLQSPSRPSMMSSRPAPPKFQSSRAGFAKAQSFGAVPRAFGRDLSNTLAAHENGMLAPHQFKACGPSTLKGMTKGKMLPPPPPGTSSSKNGAKRGALPMQWKNPQPEPLPAPKALFRPALSHRETEPVKPPQASFASSSRSSDDNEMDVDSPCRPGSSGPSNLFKVPQSPLNMIGPASASVEDSPGLGSFFCDSPGPSALAAAKRRSLVSSSPASPSNSPTVKRSALGQGRPSDKQASTGMLFGSSRPNTIASRRGQPYPKRPVLGAIAATHEGPRTVSTSSAFSILYAQPEISASSSQLGPVTQRSAMAPMRRAFSVCDPPPLMPDMSEDDEDGSYDSPSVSATHAEYARRHHPRGLTTHIDGSPGFRPALSAGMVPQCQPSPAGNKGRKMSPYGPGGLPGFGDNEMDGKILPCHKVKEDGLVRISPDTLEDVLAGRYKNRMKRYHIIDCRFDYEYEGGHIGGAISVKDMNAVEELLLKDGKGVHQNGEALPQPSRSGQLPDGENVVLIFHCEFSAKRAPTFAKHLRSRDRMLNNHLYPKISYPELYILEGGYCGFFQSRPERCFPRAYIPMDDPKHAVRRNSDLHDFRKFSRTRSFTYGETQSQSQPPSAANRPPCPPLAFAAASVAAGRRGAHDGHTIAEEEDADSSCEISLDGSGPSISPCPPASRAPIFGSAKTRLTGHRGAFSRVASYAGPPSSHR